MVLHFLLVSSKIEKVKNICIDIILVLLVFGEVTDIFTNQTFSLCDLDFSIFDGLCPPGIQLAPDNFLANYQYASS